MDAAPNFGLSLRWITVTCFEFRFGSLRVVSDPFITDAPGTELDGSAIEACDLITLSHGHWDHIMDLPLLMERFQPRLLCGELMAEPLADWLNCSPSRIYPMTPDLELDFGDMKVRALFGRHTDLVTGYCDQVRDLAGRPLLHGDPKLVRLQAVGCLEYRNYLFTLPDGTRLVLWGSDPTPEQRSMLRALHPDIGLLQLSRQDPVEMGNFAADIGVRVLIPHHMDLKLKEAQYASRVEKLRETFLARVPGGRFLSPGHGEWVTV